MAQSVKTLKAKITALQIEKRQIELSGTIDVVGRVASIDGRIDELLDEYATLLQPV